VAEAAPGGLFSAPFPPEPQPARLAALTIFKALARQAPREPPTQTVAHLFDIRIPNFLFNSEQSNMCSQLSHLSLGMGCYAIACYRLQAVAEYHCVGSYFATSRCRRSYSITTPSKRNPSATSHFAINRCGLICSITTHCGIGSCQLHGVAQKQARWSIQFLVLKWGRVCFRWARFWALSSPGWLVYRPLWPALSAFCRKCGAGPAQLDNW
jgi:hypothetical protein